MMRKRLATLLVSVGLLATVGIGASLAYLTAATDDVTNTFSVGNVQITLDETDVDNSTEGENRDTENKYENLIPGQTVVKDPIVHMAANSISSYVFVHVTGLDANQDKLQVKYMDGEGLANGINPAWQLVKLDTKKNDKGQTVDCIADGIYVYSDAAKSPLKVSTGETAMDLTSVFDRVTFLPTVEYSEEEAANLLTDITIKAAAIQSEYLAPSETQTDIEKALELVESEFADEQ